MPVLPQMVAYERPRRDIGFHFVDRASSLGISPALIDATIYDAIGQRQVAQYFTQINSYHVVLEVTPALQEDPAQPSAIAMRSQLDASSSLPGLRKAVAARPADWRGWWLLGATLTEAAKDQFPDLGSGGANLVGVEQADKAI